MLKEIYDIWNDGTTVTISGFGASAPAGILQKKFGFTVENVVKAMKSVLKVLQQIELSPEAGRNHRLPGFLMQAMK